MSSMMTLSRAPPGWGESRRHCQCKQHARSMSCCLRTLMALKPQAPLFHQPRLTRGGFQRRDAHPLPCRRCRLVSLGLSLLVARRRTVRDRQQCSWSCRTDSGLETGQAQWRGARHCSTRLPFSASCRRCGSSRARCLSCERCSRWLTQERSRCSSLGLASLTTAARRCRWCRRCS